MRLFPAIVIFAAVPSLALAAPPPGLTDAEQSYYDQIFSYSMETVAPGGKYDWSSYSGSGSIGVDKQFVSKSGATCRNFTENFNVQGQAGSGKGVGCKRVGKDGWCKLKPDNALTCAMEPPSNIVEEKLRDATEWGGRRTTTYNSTKNWFSNFFR